MSLRFVTGNAVASRFLANQTSRRSGAGTPVASVAAILLRGRGVQANCVIVQVAPGDLQCFPFGYFAGRHHFS